MVARKQSQARYERANRKQSQVRERRYELGNLEKRRCSKRATGIKRRYGISIDEWNALFVAQGAKCAVCESVTTAGSGWHTDHDHDTGKVRGILCNHCNLGIGHFRDSAGFCVNAARYLERHGR